MCIMLFFDVVTDAKYAISIPADLNDGMPHKCSILWWTLSRGHESWGQIIQIIGISFINFSYMISIIR